MSVLPDPRELETDRSVVTILLGDRKTNTLENRVFNAVGLLVSFTGIFTALLNYFSGNPIREVIFSSIAAIVGATFYIVSIRFHKDRYLRIPMVVFFLGLLSVAWFTNQGSQGATPLFFFILFASSTIVLESPYDILLLGISFTAVIALLIIEWYNPVMVLPYLSESHRFLDVAASLIIGLIIITLLVYLVVTEYQKERIRSEMLYEQVLKDKKALEQAFAEIKVMKGILPVCSFCKKIRDENNEWHTMEHYISYHSQAEFSHGFCPDCAKEHYPDYFNERTEGSL